MPKSFVVPLFHSDWVGSKLQFEYLSTDRWLYNYHVSDNSKDLTYTFVEKIVFPQTHYFYRHVGHYLGSNTQAFFLDFDWKEFKIHLNQINRGNSYILDYENLQFLGTFGPISDR